MKTIPLDSFLKFYVMRSPGIDLYGIAHVKVDFIPLQKMYVIPILGRFVWTSSFVQCGTSFSKEWEALYYTTDLASPEVPQLARSDSECSLNSLRSNAFSLNIYSPGGTKLLFTPHRIVWSCSVLRWLW